MNTPLVRHMLVSDLEGAILGSEESLLEFADWAAQEGSQMPTAYYVREVVLEPREVLHCHQLPTPDYLITAIGSQIFDFASDKWIEAWEALHQRNWSAEQVLGVIESVLGRGTRCAVSRHKVSVALGEDPSMNYHTIQAALANARVAATCTMTGSQLDVLPVGVSQHSAIQFLSNMLRLSSKHVIACGGSASAPSLFFGPFSGVLVASSTIVVPPALAGLVYRSPFKHADGVIDGVQYWREQWVRR